MGLGLAYGQHAVHWLCMWYKSTAEAADNCVRWTIGDDNDAERYVVFACFAEMLAKFTEVEKLEGQIYACDRCNGKFVILLAVCMTCILRNQLNNSNN